MCLMASRILAALSWADLLISDEVSNTFHSFFFFFALIFVFNNWKGVDEDYRTDRIGVFGVSLIIIACLAFSNIYVFNTLKLKNIDFFFIFQL